MGSNPTASATIMKTYKRQQDQRLALLMVYDEVTKPLKHEEILDWMIESFPKSKLTIIDDGSVQYIQL